MKAGLDLEIGMYHCLVATEEERLGLQPGDGGTDDGDDGGGNDDDDDDGGHLPSCKKSLAVGKIILVFGTESIDNDTNMMVEA